MRRLREAGGRARCARLSVHSVLPDLGHDVAGHKGTRPASTAEPLEAVPCSTDIPLYTMRDDTSTRRRQRCRATLPSHRRSSPYESGTKAVTVHNQRHPGPLIRNDAPTEASTVQDRRIRPTLSRINWRIAVAHHPAQDTGQTSALPKLALVGQGASLRAASCAEPR